MKFDILASLHPSFDFRAQADRKTHLGQYLSGGITFRQLLGRLGGSKPSTTKGKAKSKKKHPQRRKPKRA